MAYADDLLKQAAGLATLDKLRPRQVNLRRAVSSAYYSLFHLLATDASQRCAPSSQPKLAMRIARACEHGEMNKLCKQVAGGTPSDEIRALGINAYSDSLRRVAGTFADLQEERHTADYDLADFYSRAEVQTLIQRVEESFVLWTSIRDSPETEIFLAALLFARRWSK